MLQAQSYWSWITKIQKSIVVLAFAEAHSAWQQQSARCRHPGCQCGTPGPNSRQRQALAVPQHRLLLKQPHQRQRSPAAGRLLSQHPLRRRQPSSSFRRLRLVLPANKFACPPLNRSRCSMLSQHVSFVPADCFLVCVTVTSGMLFPWERRQFDGSPGGLKTWEKLYWGVFVTCISLYLFSRIAMPNNTQDTKVQSGLAWPHTRDHVFVIPRL